MIPQRKLDKAIHWKDVIPSKHSKRKLEKLFIGRMLFHPNIRSSYFRHHIRIQEGDDKETNPNYCLKNLGLILEWPLRLTYEGAKSSEAKDKRYIALAVNGYQPTRVLQVRHPYERYFEYDHVPATLWTPISYVQTVLETPVNVQKVQEWLKKLFQEEEIPAFEDTEDVMESLRRIMLKNKEAERDVREMIKTEQKYTEIYKNKIDEMGSFLNGESLSLSSETLDHVESIATLGNKLNLKEPTLTNFLLALNEAENKEMETKEKEMVDDYYLASLSKKVTKVMKTNDSLRRDLVMLEKTAEHQEAYKPKVLNKNSFLDTKIEEYKHRIKKYERDLAKRDYDSSLEHNRLIQRAESIQELEKDVQSLHFKLNSYQSLPPNESLTRLKIQTTRNELAALEEEFQELLESASGASLADNSDAHLK